MGGIIVKGTEKGIREHSSNFRSDSLYSFRANVIRKCMNAFVPARVKARHLSGVSLLLYFVIAILFTGVLPQ